MHCEKKLTLKIVYCGACGTCKLLNCIPCAVRYASEVLGCWGKISIRQEHHEQAEAPHGSYYPSDSGLIERCDLSSLALAPAIVSFHVSHLTSFAPSTGYDCCYSRYSERLKTSLEQHLADEIEIVESSEGNWNGRLEAYIVDMEPMTVLYSSRRIRRFCNFDQIVIDMVGEIREKLEGWRLLTSAGPPEDEADGGEKIVKGV